MRPFLILAAVSVASGLGAGLAYWFLTGETL